MCSNINNLHKYNFIRQVVYFISFKCWLINGGDLSPDAQKLFSTSHICSPPVSELFLIYEMT